MTFYIHSGTTNITSTPRDANATLGQSIQLPCVAKGYPVPAVTWSKDGISIPFDQRQSVSGDNTLHISSVQKGDAGRYKCTAVNSDSKKDERFVVLTVFGEWRLFQKPVLFSSHRRFRIAFTPSFMSGVFWTTNRLSFRTGIVERGRKLPATQIRDARAVRWQNNFCARSCVLARLSLCSI